jgi:hypothetical protein
MTIPSDGKRRSPACQARFVRLSATVLLWDHMWLPDRVRRAWAQRLAAHRGQRMPC